MSAATTYGQCRRVNEQFVRSERVETLAATELTMTRSIRRILVAVKDVRGRSSPALKKAARLARALNARMELFHAISEPVAVDALAFSREGIGKFEATQHARYLKRLERMAAPLRRTGVTVNVAAEWDYPVHEAVVRRALRTGADLIIAERHASAHIAPWMLRYADWELLRHSPVPVLLIKTRRAYDSVKVLAAIDPSHRFHKTARLDDGILRIAAQMSAAVRGQLHVLHAYVPSLADVPAAELTLPDATARIVLGAEAAAAKRLAKALRSARLGSLPPGRRHLVGRHPVMGLVRSGFKGLFIGNTAEQLLDELACDLLIVKPPDFRSRVPARPRGPQLISLGPAYGAA
jgi:universal stress protein E